MTKHYKGKSIGIILTYNSASTLSDIYHRIPKDVLDEIIVVDDGSTDGTVQVAESLGLRVFSHKHHGYGGNMKFSLQKALEMGAEYMVEIHGDGQYDPAAIPEALSKMRDGCDFLLGSRFIVKKQALKDGMPFVRYFANRALSFFDRVVLGVNLTEFHTGFRVYSRRFLTIVNFEQDSDDHLFSFETIAQACFFNLKLCEISVRCDYRNTHTSISIWESTIFSFKMFYILLLYSLARLGIKSKLFCTREGSSN